MRARLFALTLALGALLCTAPSAAALDAQPEAAPDTPTVETQDENAAPLPDELAPAGVSEEVPILPEKPPTMISSTTPEEIGFVWEEVISEEQTLLDELTHPEGEPAPSDDTTTPDDTTAAGTPADDTATVAPAPADTDAAPAETVPDDTASTASTTPAVPTLPQTGTMSGFARAMLAAGGLLVTVGALLTRRRSA